MQGQLHPSLRVFIDCFMSNPLPKVYPRGGGPHDQDPVLMADFRKIRNTKVQLEQAQAEVDKATGNSGGGFGLEAAIANLSEEHGI